MLGKHLCNLRVEVIFVSHEEDKLAQVALKELLGDGRAHSSSASRKQHTLTLKLAFEVQRGQVALSLLSDLRDDCCSSAWGFNCEEISDTSKEVSESADNGLLVISLRIVLLRGWLWSSGG